MTGYGPKDSEERRVMEVNGTLFKIPSDRNRRRYVLSEKVVAEFMSRPPEKRMETLRQPNKKAEDLQCGAIDALQGVCGHVVAHVALDSSLPGGKELKALIEGGKTLICSLCGHGHVDERGAVMDSIEYVAILEPHDAPH